MVTTNTNSSFDLVNRENELRTIDEALYRLTTPGRLLPKPILEFNGIGGIGKTALLKKFRQECMEKKLHYSFVDFAEFDKAEQIDLNMIIINIVQQIDIKNDLFYQIISSASEADPIQDLTPKVIEYLDLILKKPQEEIPLALIFDSVDEVDQNVKKWLISIIDRTIEAGKILYAVASKISLGFSQLPKLERRVYSFRLKELDQKYTLEQLRVFSHFDEPEELENWARAVYRLTHGHPLANEIVMSEAKKKKYHPHNIDSIQYEFVQIIDQQVVTEKVFHRYDSKEINRLRQILTPLSLPRLFNLVSMGKLIGKFAPEHALRSSWHYSNYIRELQAETSFIHYSREKSAYVVDPILRSVFSLTLKNEELDKFGTMHEFLIDMYTDWIADARGTDKTKFFIEKTYHQLVLGEAADSLLPNFKDFAQIIGQNMSEDKCRDAKQQFIMEFSLDPDLGEFFDESIKYKIRKMFE